jgi:hypothetical protein
VYCSWLLSGLTREQPQIDVHLLLASLLSFLLSRLPRESESKRRDADRRLSPPRGTILVSMLTDLLCFHVCSSCLYLLLHPCSLCLVRMLVTMPTLSLALSLSLSLLYSTDLLLVWLCACWSTCCAYAYYLLTCCKYAYYILTCCAYAYYILTCCAYAYYILTCCAHAYYLLTCCKYAYYLLTDLLWLRL